jgi:hypothetical protein
MFHGQSLARSLVAGARNEQAAGKPLDVIEERRTKTLGPIWYKRLGDRMAATTTTTMKRLLLSMEATCRRALETGLDLKLT